MYERASHSDGAEGMARFARSPMAACVGRRQLLGAATLLAAAPLPGCTDSAAVEASVPPNAPTLYYVYASDCGYCEEWNANFRSAFEATAVRAKLHFVLLRSPAVRFGAFADDAWPADLRWLRADLIGRHVPNALPMFVLVRDHAYVASVVGEYPRRPFGWQNNFYDTLAREVGA